MGGLVEDPATGAAAAAFGGYLRAVGQVVRARTLTIHQGVDLGRPSLLQVHVRPDDPRVVVTGSAVRLPRSRDTELSPSRPGAPSPGTGR